MNFLKKLYLCALLFVSLLFVSFNFLYCDFPYSPEIQNQPIKSTPLISNLKVINPMRQICNPSASQDTVNFKGCMLFLNLGGVISVNVPAKWKSEYNVIADNPHDRLTIVDTNNSVRWFLKKPSFITEYEIQDPEWTVNADYITFLGDNDDQSSGYVVRLSNKTIFKFNNQNLHPTSTPHMWKRPDVSSTIDTLANPILFSANIIYDSLTGMADKNSLINYFETDSIIFTFSKKNTAGFLSIQYINYSDTVPSLISLNRPEKREDFHLESPLISPDGKWVLFNCKKGILACEAYVQCLNKDSKPILIHEGMAAEPHWWKSPGTNDCYIIFCTKVGPIEELYENVKNDGTLGYTLIRKFNPSVTSSIQWLSLLEKETILSQLPFQGGLSPDGHFLVTGYQYGYIYKLN